MISGVVMTNRAHLLLVDSTFGMYILIIDKNRLFRVLTNPISEATFQKKESCGYFADASQQLFFLFDKKLPGFFVCDVKSYFCTIKNIHNGIWQTAFLFLYHTLDCCDLVFIYFYYVSEFYPELAGSNSLVYNCFPIYG